MDSSHSRPLDTRPASAVGDVPHDDQMLNRLFVSRLEQLTENRQRLQRRAVLAKLRLLQTSLLSHTAVSQDAPQLGAVPAPTSLADSKQHGRKPTTRDSVVDASEGFAASAKSSPLTMRTGAAPPLIVRKHAQSLSRNITQLYQAYRPSASRSISASHSASTSPLMSPTQIACNSHANPPDPTDVRDAHRSSHQFLPTSHSRTGDVLPHMRLHYMPPFTAALYFEQELASLFDHDFQLTTSTAQASLARATQLYNHSLFPNLSTANISETQLSLASSTKSQKAIHIAEQSCSGPGESTLQSSPPVHSDLSKQGHDKPIRTPFQRRTYYGRMTDVDEQRAPVATWQADNDAVTLATDTKTSRPSHPAYGVAADTRGHSAYMNMQGVHSGPGLTAVTLAFGFQRRTSYPFRKSYKKPRAPSASVPESRKSLCFLPDFAARVPTTGLKPALLEAFQAGHARGRFFQPDAKRVSDGPAYDARTDEILYVIDTGGKLVPDGNGDE